MRTAPPPSPPTAPPISVITVDVAMLEGILHHAEFAAHLVGHLDDKAHAELIGQISDRVDAVVHGLTEILAAPDAVARGRAPMLTSIAGDAP